MLEAKPLANWINPNKEQCMKYIADFHKLFIIEPESKCWIWISTTNSKGKPSTNYPTFNNGHWNVSMLAWSFYKGNIPVNLEIVQLCKNPLCINPDHHEFVDKGAIYAEKLEKVNRIRKKAETLSIQQIAIEEQLSYQATYNIVRGVSYNKSDSSPPPLEKVKKYKIGEEMYPDISYKIKEGIKIDDLAKEYKVSYTTMYKVVKLIKELGV